MEIVARYTMDGTPYQCPLCVRIFFSPIAYGRHKCENKRVNENRRYYKNEAEMLRKVRLRAMRGRR